MIIIVLVDVLFIFGFDLNVSSTNGLSNKLAAKAATNQPEWLDTVAEPSDYDYSFAVIGDTQVISYIYPNNMHTIYDWIVDNKDTHKISHVFGVGDITEKWAKNDQEALTEWGNAKEAIYKMMALDPSEDLPASILQNPPDDQTHRDRHTKTRW